MRGLLRTGQTYYFVLVLDDLFQVFFRLILHFLSVSHLQRLFIFIFFLLSQQCSKLAE